MHKSRSLSFSQHKHTHTPSDIVFCFWLLCKGDARVYLCLPICFYNTNNNHNTNNNNCMLSSYFSFPCEHRLVANFSGCLWPVFVFVIFMYHLLCRLRRVLHFAIIFFGALLRRRSSYSLPLPPPHPRIGGV